MQISAQLQGILDRALERKAPMRDEMVQLLRYSEQSLEAGIIRAVANRITRERSRNLAILSGQIGYATAPCAGDCAFCVFGAGHSTFPEVNMSVEEVAEHAKAFTSRGVLTTLWLMSMHQFDFARFLEIVAAVRAVVPEYVIVSSNVGDLTLEQAKELKAAGLAGAYHTIRLREGLDTKLDRNERIQTVRNIQEAGLHWGFCCEPIGPEHTPEELADQILFGMSLRPQSFGAMRRVWLPNSPIADRGQITQVRLAQVVAVVTFATLADPNIVAIGAHEPNLICLMSGANSACAECGANPRDETVETSKNLGLSVDNCVRMVYEAGFDGVVRPDRQVVPFSSPTNR
ncbi:MAG: radical SAM protein [Rhodopirellula sp.]|nr:radical SAM protein [Rhodopirellula sp.]